MDKRNAILAAAAATVVIVGILWAFAQETKTVKAFQPANEAKLKSTSPPTFAVNLTLSTSGKTSQTAWTVTPAITEGADVTKGTVELLIDNGSVHTVDRQKADVNTEFTYDAAAFANKGPIEVRQEPTERKNSVGSCRRIGSGN